MAETNITIVPPTKRKRSRFTDTTEEDAGKGSLSSVPLPYNTVPVPTIPFSSSSSMIIHEKKTTTVNSTEEIISLHTTTTTAQTDTKRPHTDIPQTIHVSTHTLSLPAPVIMIPSLPPPPPPPPPPPFLVPEKETIHRSAIGTWDTTTTNDNETNGLSTDTNHHQELSIISPPPPPPPLPGLPMRQLTSYGDQSPSVVAVTNASDSISLSSISSSSTAHISSTIITTATTAVSAQDDMIRKRKERLEQWKLKQTQTQQSSSTGSVLATATSTIPSATIISQPPPVLDSTSSSSLTAASSLLSAPILSTNSVRSTTTGGVKLSLKPLGLGTFSKNSNGSSSTKLTSVNTTGQSSSIISISRNNAANSVTAIPSKPKQLQDEDDEMDNRTNKSLSLPFRLPNASLEKNSSNNNEKEDNDDDEDKMAIVSSTTLSQGNDSNDELDQYMAGLGDILPGVSEALASVRSGVVTYDDFESTNTDENGMEVDKMMDTLTKTKSIVLSTNEEEEERYHQLFIQSLRPAALITNLDKTEQSSGSNSSSVAMVPFSSTTTAEKNNSSTSQPSSSSSQLEDDIALDEEIALFDSEEWKEERSALDILKEKMAKKEIKAIDHATIAYLPFRKDFYIEAKEITALSEEAISSLREDLEITVRGKTVPRPLTTWEHTGLPDKLVNVLIQRNFNAPFAIQRQALPIIMSGRDIIGVARTGSGKTLAYLLPLFRQIMDQPPLREGDGPIALIMAPARELVVQIYHEARKLAKALDIRVTAIYGGAPVAEQIRSLKRGSELVVCTPGRMIDILTMNAGRTLNFHRVTYIVLDEADRMFDMGFEPQISRILSLIRPDRQTVMFSATFPTHVEGLARKVLLNPIEVVVGGRSKASPHIQQFVEIFDDVPYFPGMTDASNGGNKKYRRLLQLLGDWYEQGSIIIFVDTKEHCDSLFADLLKAGYPTLSLHGGKDQNDRDQTITDFKAGIRTIMIATSVAGRGLDVKNLVLVINYACPNHLEDYVHRVGRTGRAGKQGTAYTFLTPSEAPYAYDLIRALKDAKQSEHISPELTKMAEEHKRKVDAGEARKRSSGYSSAKGYKFDDSELSNADAMKKAQKLAYEVDAGITTVEDYLAEEAEKREVQEMNERLEADIHEDKVAEKNLREGKVHVNVKNLLDEEETPGDSSISGTSITVPVETVATACTVTTTVNLTPSVPMVDLATLEQLRAKALFAKQAVAIGLVTLDDAKLAEQALDEAEKAYTAGIAEMAAVTAAKVAAAKAAASAFTKTGSITGITGTDANNTSSGTTPEELEINDYPQQARWKLIKEGVKRIEEWTGATLTPKGTFIQPGRSIPNGERKLYLFIEGPTDIAIRKAKTEARRILEEEALRVGLHSTGSQYGKFQI